jgi:hypothetical protein
MRNEDTMLFSYVEMFLIFVQSVKMNHSIGQSTHTITLHKYYTLIVPLLIFSYISGVSKEYAPVLSK